ncbi:MAG: O-antigen ligase family protein [Epsilonproteobacteria bacterium]|nr:O-antigen ligase family protein [Campylobacterota bacterium]
MQNNFLIKVKHFINDKDLLTLWMNNFLVAYAFLLPISPSFRSTLFIDMVLLFLLRGNIKENLRIAWQNPIIRSFVYLFGIYVIGLLWTDNLKHGLWAVKSIKYGLYLIIFYLIVDGRYISKVLSAFILGMLFSEIISYGMLLGILPWQLDIEGVRIYTAYAIGDPSPFLHHIHYGVALAFVVLLLAQRIIYSNSSKLIKIFMSLFILTATANIFVTGGRTGYLTFIALLLILAFSYLKKYFFQLLIAIPLLFTIAYNTSPIFKEKVIQTEKSFSSLFDHKPDINTSIGQRAAIYYYGFDVFKNNPLLGVGSGDSMDEIKKLVPKEFIGIHAMPHEHNQFLSTLISLGIVGLLIFLNVYYQIFRYKQEDKELRFIMIFSTLAITFGILTTQFNLRFFMPLWVVMLAVSMISKNRRTIKREIDDKRVFLEVSAIIIAISAIRFFKHFI